MTDFDDTRFSDREYKTLLTWFMVSDPWPLSDTEHVLIKTILDGEAERRGSDTWVHAYHELTWED